MEAFQISQGLAAQSALDLLEWKKGASLSARIFQFLPLLAKELK